jgi:hypothetical protein
MNVPPALFLLLLPAAIVIGWLYLHANADVKQRIDIREAWHQIDSAQIDKDFARIAGDKAGEAVAERRIEAGEQKPSWPSRLAKLAPEPTSAQKFAARSTN